MKKILLFLYLITSISLVAQEGEAIAHLKVIKSVLQKDPSIVTPQEIQMLTQKFNRLNIIKPYINIETKSEVEALEKQFIALKAPKKKPLKPEIVEVTPVVPIVTEAEIPAAPKPTPVTKIPPIVVKKTKEELISIAKNKLAGLLKQEVTFKNYNSWEDNFGEALGELFSLDQKAVNFYKGQKNIKLLGILNTIEQKLERNDLTQDDRVNILSLVENLAKDEDVSKQVQKKAKNISDRMIL